MYAAQANPKIDAAKAEKDPFRTETNLAEPHCRVQVLRG